ncbi:YugN family protein [Lentibacillus salinarum]|uniref:YugN family protein n=1 Tax=Lentibacillus salinarum TaxID=446820 RepID=A0ABW3ZSW9_9BACI
MIPLDSSICNHIYPLYVLEERLKPDGFIFASNWNYQERYVDIKIDDQGVYYALRIPFYAVSGSLDYPGVTVRIDQPFLLDRGYDNAMGPYMVGKATTGEATPVPSPAFADTGTPGQPVQAGKRIMQKVERLLLPG